MKGQTQTLHTMNKKIILSAATIAALAGILSGSAALAATVPTTGASATGTVRAAAVKQAANARKAAPKFKARPIKARATSTLRSAKRTTVVKPTATSTAR